jgi:hypothetical protein
MREIKFITKQNPTPSTTLTPSSYYSKYFIFSGLKTVSPILNFYIYMPPVSAFDGTGDLQPDLEIGLVVNDRSSEAFYYSKKLKITFATLFMLRSCKPWCMGNGAADT